MHPGAGCSGLCFISTLLQYLDDLVNPARFPLKNYQMYNSIKKNGAISDMQITTWSLDRQAEYFRGEVIINCLLSNIPSITTFVQMYS